jgi:hypothetical protein
MAAVLELEQASDRATRRASVLIALCHSGIDGSSNHLACDCTSAARARLQTIFTQVGEA